jgi:ParB family transcriptional regulator, chromosome partitioning protein
MTDYEVKEVPLTKVFSDEDFNCRGVIPLIDVSDLAKDIDKNGLQFPITVQPYLDSDDYDYRIIAGHRRFAAFRVLKRETIPVMIRDGLSELQARLLNLTENLKRKDLNILQEAQAVIRLRELGLTQEAIASELTMSRTWVRVRLCLLDLPKEIQEEAAAGLLNQYQIQQLHSMGSAEEQYEAVKRIKTARINGEKSVDVGKKSAEKPFVKKRQPKTAVQEMIEHIGQSLGFSLTTRALAWANGEISSAELYFDIRREAQDKGIDYTIPFLQESSSVG